MKQFVIVNLIILVSTVLVSCGYQRAFREHCRIGDTQTCDNLFGVNQAEIDANQSAQLSAQQKEIDSLQTMMTELVKDLKAQESKYTQTQVFIDMLNLMAMQQDANINTINQMLADMNQELEQAADLIAYQQAQINGLAIDVANLQNQGNNVIESIYPCSDSPGKFDEAFLRLPSGKLLAYFESGNGRFLTELTPGSYRSTDYSPYCTFDVNASNQIVNARR